MTTIECSDVPRKTCLVFFVIGTSGSMAGTCIGALNSVMEQTIEKLREMNENSEDGVINVAILTFSSGARWLTPNGPIKAENFYWNDLEGAGAHDMGEAFRMLEEKLHWNNGFMQWASGTYAPVIFLMSDGEPTDDYKPHLEKLQNNSFFRSSVKIAIPIGDAANDAILMAFTGSKEAIVRITNGRNAGSLLMKYLKFIEIEEEYYLPPIHESPFYYDVHNKIPDDNVLWLAIQRILTECSEDIFLSSGKFKSVLVDFLNGVGQDLVRLRKRTVEAVELGVYKRLKESEQSDLERIVRVEIKKMRDEGIDETTAQEIVYTFAKLFVKSNMQKSVQYAKSVQYEFEAACDNDEDWDIGKIGDMEW